MTTQHHIVSLEVVATCSCGHTEEASYEEQAEALLASHIAEQEDTQDTP